MLIEKITQDKLYNEGLHWVNKMIKILNQDERSAHYKNEY